MESGISCGKQERVETKAEAGTARYQSFVSRTKLHHADESHVRLLTEGLRSRIIAENQATVTVRTRATDHSLLAQGRRSPGDRSLGIQGELAQGVPETGDRKEEAPTK